MSKKWMDKKNAQTFRLVHRSHDDPLYFDQEASEHVFVPVEDKRQTNIRLATQQDLQADLEDQLSKGEIRRNEGEAALYGITYDDSQYDYMQHLKPIGEDTNGIFIAKQVKPEPSVKKEIIIKDNLLPLPSTKQVEFDYQKLKDVPDEISGFQPDMDPRIREVLEALEDEAYLDEGQDVDEGDIFDDLLKDGEIDEEEEQDEWDLDNYEDPYEEDQEVLAAQPWEEHFKQFKKDQTKVKNDWDSDDEFDEDEEGDLVADLPSIDHLKSGSKQKQRRKKGAMTDTSSFSMTSSANFRSKGLTLLDDRYDQVAKQYDVEQESEEEYKPFDMENERQDLEGMLDEFLDNYELESGGRRIVKKDEELHRLQEAADSVSKSKHARKRRAEKELAEKMGKMAL